MRTSEGFEVILRATDKDMAKQHALLGESRWRSQSRLAGPLIPSTAMETRRPLEVDPM